MTRGHFDERGCFIAGQGKSGTTLLLALLEGHPRLLSFPEETAYLPTVLRKFRADQRHASADYLMQHTEARLLFSQQARGGGRDYSAFPREEMRTAFLAALAHPGNERRDLLAVLMQTYAEVTGMAPASVVRWIEKTPANRNHLPEILRIFPSAKILLTIRDPRGVFDARLKRERGKKQSALSIFDNVRNWRVAAHNAIALRGRPGFHIVRFEDLLSDPEASMRSVAEFLGIDFDPCLLTPTKAGVAWSGNSAAKTSFSGINPAPINRWRETLTRSEIAWIERHCADLMPQLGYAPSLHAPTSLRWLAPISGESARSYFRSRLKSALRLHLKRPRLP